MSIPRAAGVASSGLKVILRLVGDADVVAVVVGKFLAASTLDMAACAVELVGHPVLQPCWRRS